MLPRINILTPVIIRIKHYVGRKYGPVYKFEMVYPCEQTKYPFEYPYGTLGVYRNLRMNFLCGIESWETRNDIRLTLPCSLHPKVVYQLRYALSHRAINLGEYLESTRLCA